MAWQQSLRSARALLVARSGVASMASSGGGQSAAASTAAAAALFASAAAFLPGRRGTVHMDQAPRGAPLAGERKAARRLCVDRHSGIGSTLQAGEQAAVPMGSVLAVLECAPGSTVHYHEAPCQKGSLLAEPAEGPQAGEGVLRLRRGPLRSDRRVQ